MTIMDDVSSAFAEEARFSGPNVAIMDMKPKFANTHEKAMVKHMNVPNWLKKTRLHPKSGKDATTDVIMPLPRNRYVKLCQVHG